MLTDDDGPPHTWWVEFHDDGPAAGRLARLYERLRAWQILHTGREWMPAVDVDPDDPRYVAFRWTARPPRPALSA